MFGERLTGRKLLDLADEAKAIEGIRQELEAMKARRTMSLNDFKEPARKKHEISV